jgi:hypothetical protein
MVLVSPAIETKGPSSLENSQHRRSTCSAAAVPPNTSVCFDAGRNDRSSPGTVGRRAGPPRFGRGAGLVRGAPHARLPARGAGPRLDRASDAPRSRLGDLETPRPSPAQRPQTGRNRGAIVVPQAGSIGRREAGPSPSGGGPGSYSDRLGTGRLETLPDDQPVPWPCPGAWWVRSAFAHRTHDIGRGGAH